MERIIFQHLIKWKSSKNKKPMLLRGARQVGKTYIIRKLGEKFKYFLEVNFEMEPDLKKFFMDNLSPDILCTKLSAYYNIPLIDGETLLFFDEIQACPEALQSLRFFYEKRPDLHLIAAGSLLEFALNEISSYGVGRIESLFMYPLSFNEFLMALGKEPLIAIKSNASPENPVDEVFHKQLNDLLIKFLLIGGMPEVVRVFCETSDILESQKTLDDIINSLEDDFVKYKKRINTSRLKDIYVSVLHQTGNKFNISTSSETGNHEQKKESIEMLVMAGLCYKVFHTSANGLPLASEKNLRNFKVIFFDTGILQRSLKLNLADFFTGSNLNQINKGNIVEQYVGLEFVKNQFWNSKPELYYWHREKKGSSAEVDYVIEKNSDIIPIEVKSGIQGKMQSLFIFMEHKKQKFGIRTSLENFSKYDIVRVYPIYAIDNILK
jgi:predicted AAA+ superfamily ATPase